MNIFKPALVVCGLAVASVAVFAADGGMDDGVAWIINPGGRYTNGKLSDKGMAEMMKTAKPVTGGVAIFMSKGKLYMVDDPKGSLYDMSRDMMLHGG